MIYCLLTYEGSCAVYQFDGSAYRITKIYLKNPREMSPFPGWIYNPQLWKPFNAQLIKTEEELKNCLLLELL